MGNHLVSEMKANPRNMECANYMSFEAIREAVRKYQEEWGPRDPEDRIPYDLSELNLIRQCAICNFGGTGSPVIDQIVNVLDADTAKLQETIKRMTGEPLKRICFKELK